MKRGNPFCILRLLEIMTAILLLTASSPLIFLFASISFLQLKSYPFFSQLRGITLSAGLFKIYKIRTIPPAAEKIHCPEILYKSELAPYVTKFLSWLRSTGLDELPQLINVIRGEMHIAGPRPLSINDLVSMQEKFPYHYSSREKLKIKPGITGLWQVYGNRNSGMAGLIEMDRFYEENMSLKLNAIIILKTITIILFAGKSDSITRKAYSRKQSKSLLLSQNHL